MPISLVILGKPATWHPYATEQCVGVLNWGGMFIRLDNSLPADLRRLIPAPECRDQPNHWDDFVLVCVAYGIL